MRQNYNILGTIRPQASNISPAYTVVSIGKRFMLILAELLQQVGLTLYSRKQKIYFQFEELTTKQKLPLNKVAEFIGEGRTCDTLNFCV